MSLPVSYTHLDVYKRQEEISACTAVIADLRWKLADLTRRLWGKSSEKRHLPEDAGQLSICFESPSDVNELIYNVPFANFFSDQFIRFFAKLNLIYVGGTTLL